MIDCCMLIAGVIRAVSRQGREGLCVYCGSGNRSKLAVYRTGMKKEWVVILLICTYLDDKRVHIGR